MSAQSNDPFHEFEHAQWQAVVERYHDSWGYLTRQTIPALLDVLRVKAGVRLLDVASGPGYVASEARSRGADVVGVDFSDAMVARARVLYPDTHFQEGNAENLPFADASFDAVAMNFGMLHLAQPDLAINEAFRVLQSGGRFSFTVWAGPDQTVAFAMVLGAVKDFGEPVNLPAGPTSSGSALRKPAQLRSMWRASTIPGPVSSSSPGGWIKRATFSVHFMGEPLALEPCSEANPQTRGARSRVRCKRPLRDSRAQMADSRFQWLR